MYEGRNLREEVKELGIVAMEDFGLGSRESAFAALDVIREHNRQFPEEKLLEMNQAAVREANANMSGTKNSGGGD